MYFKHLCLVVTLCASAHTLIAQWGADGRVYLPPYEATKPSARELEDFKMNVQVDSKDRVVVAWTEYIGRSTLRRLVVARFFETGVIDSSFGTNGLVQLTFPESVARAYKLMIDVRGRINAAANFESTSVVARLLESGEPDSTFNVDGRVYLPNRLFSLNMGLNVTLLANVYTKPNMIFRIDSTGVLDSIITPNRNAAHVLQTSRGYLMMEPRRLLQINNEFEIDSAWGKNGALSFDLWTGPYYETPILVNDSTLIYVYAEDEGTNIAMCYEKIHVIDVVKGAITASRGYQNLFSERCDNLSHVGLDSNMMVNIAGYGFGGNQKHEALFWRFKQSLEFDDAFFGSGTYTHAPRPPDSNSHILGIALFKDGDVAFVENTFHVGRLNVLTTSVDELKSISNELNVWPNPTTSSITIQHSVPFNEIVIVDVMGRTVESLLFESATSHIVQTNSLAPGLYSLRITQSNGPTQQTQFIKQ